VVNRPLGDKQLTGDTSPVARTPLAKPETVMKILTIAELLYAKVGDILGKMPGVDFQEGINFTNREAGQRNPGEPVFLFQGRMMIRDFLYLVNKWECDAGVYLTFLYVGSLVMTKRGLVEVQRKIDVFISRELVDEDRDQERRLIAFNKEAEERVRQKNMAESNSPFKPELFKVSLHSGFWDADNKRVNRGDWRPTYFKYVDGPARNGVVTLWLVVGPQREVTLAGRTLFLEPTPTDGFVEGMVDLERPCVARLMHKARHVAVS
jgi:hypothetical protein